MTSDNNHPFNSKSKYIVYSVSGCLLKIKTKPFGLRNWKRQLKPRMLLELLLLVSDVRSLKEVDCHPRLGRSGSHISTFDKAAIRHNTILHCEETVADSKYFEFNPGWGSEISRECGDSEEARESVSLLLKIGL